jgi:hypothetical protein
VKPAAEEYQLYQHDALQGLPGISVIADDILVDGCGATMEEALQDHDHNLTQLLQRVREINRKLNKDLSITYMGHVLTAEGLKPDPRRWRQYSKFPHLQTQKQCSDCLVL